jgi:hypothetical protein
MPKNLVSLGFLFCTGFEKEEIETTFHPLYFMDFLQSYRVSFSHTVAESLVESKLLEKHSVPQPSRQI